MAATISASAPITVARAAAAAPSARHSPAYARAAAPAGLQVAASLAHAPSHAVRGLEASAFSGRVKTPAARRNSIVMASAGATAIEEPTDATLTYWKTANAVCFDVDSTVCLDEGIDELAGFLGKYAEVEAWTTKAMDGGVTFQEALGARLGIMEPSKAAIDEYLAGNPPKISPGMAELVKGLQARGTSVYLVSGGFRQMINPVADILGVPRDMIHANLILHDADGNYSGFDETEFTCRSGGKADAIKHLKSKNGYETVVMIGDGATDLEARQPGGASMFVGYGGVQAREKVMAGADWFVYNFDRLIAEL